MRFLKLGYLYKKILKIKQFDCNGPIWNLPRSLVQESWVSFYKKVKIW